MTEEWRPFEPSPEAELRNDLARIREEVEWITGPDFIPEFDPAPREERCPAWSNERKLVGCTRERGHVGPHANHTIRDWTFEDACLVETQEDWTSYLERHLGGDWRKDR